MKKSFSLLSLTLCLSLFLITGCKNFFQGGDFIEQLNDAVFFANASSVNVNISTINGTVSNNGDHTLKVGETISATYTEGSSGYQFVTWIIEPADSVSFLEGNSNSPAATFKIESSASSISISPKTYIRPKIVTEKSSPGYDKNGVPKNSSIYFTFSQKLSTDNDLSRIQITKGNDTLLGNEDSTQDNFSTPKLNDFELTIGAKLDNMAIVTGVENVEVRIPGDFYYIADDNKITFGEDLIYSYRVNTETVEKAEINFSCTSGTITPNGVKTYNIGESFTAEYSKLDAYDFTGWEITAADYDQVIADGSKIIAQKLADDGTATESLELFTFEDHLGDKVFTRKCTVLNIASGITFSPIGELKPQISDYAPHYDNKGVDYDTDVVIYFNKEMDESSLNKNNIQIKNQISGKDFSSYFTFSPLTEEGKTTLTLIPNYSLKNEFTSELLNIEITIKTPVKDNLGTQLTGLNTWFYCVKNNSEKVKPKMTLEIYKSGNLENPYHVAKLKAHTYSENWTEAEVKENHIGKPYICITDASDNKSGVDKVKITETLLRDKQNNEVPADPQITYYGYDTNNNWLFTTTGKTNSDGETLYEYKFDYNFVSTNDGVARLEIELLDKAGNATEPVVYDVIKDTAKITNVTIGTNKFQDNPEMLIPPEYREGGEKQGMDIPYPFEYTALEFTTFSVTPYEYYTFPSSSEQIQTEQKVLIKIQEEGKEPEIIKFSNEQWVFDVNGATINCEDLNKSISLYKRNNSLDAQMIIYVFNDSGNDNITTEKLNKGPSVKSSPHKYNEAKLGHNASSGKTIKYFIQYKETEKDSWSKLLSCQSTLNNTALSQILNKQITKGIIKAYAVYYEQYGNSIISSLSKPATIYFFEENPAVTDLFNSQYSENFNLPSLDDILHSTNGAVLKGRTAYFTLPAIYKPDEKYSYLYSIGDECYQENETVQLTLGKNYELKVIAVNNYNIKVAESPNIQNYNLKDAPNIDNAKPLIPSFISNQISDSKNVSDVEYTPNYFKYLNSVPRDSTNNIDYKVLTDLYYYFIPTSAGEITYEDSSAYKQYYMKLEKGKNCNYNNETETKVPDYKYDYYFGLMKDDYFRINFDELDYGSYQLYYYLKDEADNEQFDYLRMYHNTNISYYISSEKPTYSISSASKMTVTTIPYAQITDLKNKPQEILPTTNTAGDYAFNFCSYQYLENNEWKLYIPTDDDYKYKNYKIMKTENNYIRTLAGDKKLSATLDVSDKKFIRILSKCSLLYTSNDNTKDTPYQDYSERPNEKSIFFTPVYVCVPWETGGITTCENKSWIDVGNGKQIFCDAPCFVHTMYSSRNYTEETTPEAASEWEKRGIETGLKFKDTSSFTSFTYTNDNYKDIERGKYYTTIAHFADGTVLMTPPVRKN